MNLTIYRGAREIGGTLIELKSGQSRILIDAGYPLFLNNRPIENEVSALPPEKLLELGVLPDIRGLYERDEPSFNAAIISHAHLDHWGLIRYINPAIPVYLSKGTRKIIELSILFKLTPEISNPLYEFDMYKPFIVGDFRIMPFLMDHSAFDAAAFEISDGSKTVIYTGDFRGHGRKSVCLDRFIDKAKKEADILLTEGTMLGRPEEEVITERKLEEMLIGKMRSVEGPVLFQASGQNIDRLVSFFRASVRSERIFVVDLYTANGLYELRQLGNNRLPYPSQSFPNIKVFYPYRLTKKVFDNIGKEYAKRFAPFHISKAGLREEQRRIVMMVRPSMKKDIELAGLRNGLFIYSMWSGYRESEYQRDFEKTLVEQGFTLDSLHTSGHASLEDIRRVIFGLSPKQIVPIHTMVPEMFNDISGNVIIRDDGVSFEV